MKSDQDRLKCARAARRWAAALLTVAASSGAVLSNELTGRASVIDGDTIEIHGTRIRLWGIDAPEHDQLCDNASGKSYQCGAIAANKLSDWINRRAVVCAPRDHDRYGRMVAACTVDRQDIGEWLVSNGLALRWPRYDRQGRYAGAQATAQKTKAGIWGGGFLEPWEYRACVRSGLRPSDCSSLHP